MIWLVGLMMVLMGLLMLWAFSATLISIAAGLITSALLWQPLRWWRRHQLLRAKAQNPALDLNAELQNHPALFYGLSALVIWLGVAAMLWTLIHLPERMFSPEQLSLGVGIAFVVSLGTLVRLVGNLLSTGKGAEAAADIKATWALASWLVPMFTVIVLIFFAPNTAGWMVWREEWRGYPSTQLRIPLTTDDGPGREALMALVQPLLQQGSRVVRYHARSRNGSSYTLLDAVPARYRFHGAALEIQLAGLMPDEQLSLHQQTLDMVARGDTPDPSLLAYAQCQPSPNQMARSLLFSQRQQLVQEMRGCVQSRAADLRTAMEALKGRLQPVEMEHNWFSPQRSNWLLLQGWQAVKLPEGDDLSRLDALR